MPLSCTRSNPPTSSLISSNLVHTMTCYKRERRRVTTMRADYDVEGRWALVGAAVVSGGID
ncbi:hypothetical protein Hanom_Chr02g00174431 [Helianthus anomalus]